MKLAWELRQVEKTIYLPSIKKSKLKSREIKMALHLLAIIQVR